MSNNTMYIYTIRGYNKREEISNDQGFIVAERYNDGTVIVVKAKDEPEAIKTATQMITRKEYRVESVQEEPKPTRDSMSKEIDKSVERRHQECIAQWVRQHKDYIQLASKANVSAERFAAALEKIEKYMQPETIMIKLNGGEKKKK